MGELSIIQVKMTAARCPEDIFGSNEDIHRTFRNLAKVVHPDHGGDKLSFSLLMEIFKEAKERINSGTYGHRLPFSWLRPITIGKYEVAKTPLRGDICDVYEGKDFFVKVARSHDDNDLMRAEAEALRTLKKIKPPVDQGVPRLIDSFDISGKWNRQANVVTKFDGFYTLEEVHARKPKLHGRTIVWVFKRLLRVIGWSHHLGIIHGAINPQHVMVFPDNANPDRDDRKHSVRLIDWCYSVGKDRTRLSAIVERYESFYAPEILARNLTHSSDTYSAAKCMIYLCDTIPDELMHILERALDKKPEMRYKNTSEIFDEWKKAAETVYGPPKWHEFEL